MYIIKVIIAVTVVLFAVTIFAEDKQALSGAKLFQQHCNVCHGLNGSMNMKKRVAPPIAGVRAHYLDVHKDKESFVNAVTSWLPKPDASKSLMPGAIRHFNIMPPIILAKEEATLIAAYIFDGDIEMPAGFKKHYEEMHGDNSSKAKKRENRQDLMTLARHLKLPPQQLQELALKPEQISKIKELIVEKEVIMQPLREEVLEFNNQLNTMDSRSANYKSEIFALADINAKRVEQMVVESGEMRMKIEAVLDQSQYETLMKYRQQTNERRKQRLKQRMQMN